MPDSDKRIDLTEIEPGVWSLERAKAVAIPLAAKLIFFCINFAIAFSLALLTREFY